VIVGVHGATDAVIIHASQAKILAMKEKDLDKDREEWLAEKLAAFEKWADEVDPADLRPAPLESIGVIAKWINQFEEVNEALARAVADARSRGLSWSQIGEILGVSGQEARQKYGTRVPAQAPS